jgi:hypothetical protein
MGKIKNSYTIFIRKPEEKRPPWKTEPWWENGIKMYHDKNRTGGRNVFR